MNFFKEGTQFYQLNLEKIGMLKAPAKVMGNHKSFEKAYIQYVAGCQEMTDSLLPEVNEEAFNAAEKKTGRRNGYNLQNDSKNNQSVIEIVNK